MNVDPLITSKLVIEEAKQVRVEGNHDCWQNVGASWVDRHEGVCRVECFKGCQWI